MSDSRNAGNHLSKVDTPEEWERVIRAAANLQTIVPDAVLVGGCAAALYAEHRFSRDDDHVVADLRSQFDAVLERLEEVSGWKTARKMRSVLILGSLDGVETGVRQLRRDKPLETVTADTIYGKLTMPTVAEMLRIKAYLVVTRNATRDYLDVAALAQKIDASEDGNAGHILSQMDSYYPQGDPGIMTMQVARQLAEPMPFDLSDSHDLSMYRITDERWKTWTSVERANASLAARVLGRITQIDQTQTRGR